jgi:hypothetical protein
MSQGLGVISEPRILRSPADLFHLREDGAWRGSVQMPGSSLSLRLPPTGSSARRSSTAGGVWRSLLDRRCRCEDGPQYDIRVDQGDVSLTARSRAHRMTAATRSPVHAHSAIGALLQHRAARTVGGKSGNALHNLHG